jgi:PAS domain S-box-containing protein
MQNKESSSTTRDEDTTREQLIHELNELRARMNRIKDRGEPQSRDEQGTRSKKHGEIPPSYGFHVLDALSDNIAILDKAGDIIFVNDAWQKFANENCGGQEVNTGPGVNYFYICENARGPNSDEATLALDGIKSVLNGEKEFYELEYPCHSPDKKRWYLMRVSPFRYGNERGIIVSHIDISRRRLAEEALKESEANLARAQHMAHIGSWYRDIRSGIMQWSDEIYRMIGARPQEFQVTYDLHLSYVYPEDRENVKNAIKAAINNEKPYDIEYRFVRNDGSICFVHSRGEVTFDEVDQPLGMFGILQDISERKRMEESLMLTQFSINNFKDAAFWVNPDGYFYYVNEEACRSLDYTREELLSMSVPDIDPDYSYARFNEHWEYLKRTGSFKFEARHRMKNGKIFPVEITSAYVKFYNDEYLVSFARDITDRKLAEESLRKLSRVVEEGPAIVMVTDLNGEIEYVNPRFTQVTGYAFDEVKGKNPRVLKSGKTSREEYEQLWATILSGHEWRGEFHNKKKDGDLYWESAIITPIKNDEGKITHFVAIKEDITERKLGEIALAESKAQAEFYLDLMAHDINNMNQVAMGYAEMALDKLASERALKEADKPLISNSLEMLKNSSRLIDNVRKLQRIKAGELRLEVVDLGRMIDESMTSFSGIQGSGIRLNIDHGQAAGCPVVANELLRDAIDNIISNAIKHSGGKARIDIGLSRIVENEREYCKLDIEDNGPGIPDELKSRLFSRFQRGRTKASGSGLGLYLVKMLIESYNGKVRVEDRVPGDHTRGSRFVILLPAAK